MTRNIPKLMAAAVIAAAALWPAAAAAEKAVVVVASDGTTTEVVLGQVKRIEIGAASATLHHDGGSHELAFADIDRIIIGSEAAAVKDLLKEGEFAVWPTQTAGPVNAVGLAPGTKLSAFSVAGALAGAATADSDGSASIDLSACQPGVYIISDGKNSVKIVKQ